jgi:hypothetical protein
MARMLKIDDEDDRYLWLCRSRSLQLGMMFAACWGRGNISAKHFL